MDFETLRAKIAERQCPRWSPRQRKLHARDLVRRNKHYSAIGLKDFEEAYTSKMQYGMSDNYIPLEQRRPATRYDLPGIIVRDSVAMLFSESKSPAIIMEDKKDTEQAAALIDAADLFTVLKNAATHGSVGSVCVVPEVFPGDPGEPGGVLFVDIWDSFECEPVFKRNKPGVLDSVRRTWSVEREALVANGYDVEALEKRWFEWEAKQGNPHVETAKGSKPKMQDWYIRREIDEQNSTWFLPVFKRIYEKHDWEGWVKDTERSTVHNLGFAPAKWIVNFGFEDYPDGVCHFEPCIDNMLFLDRVASVGGQALITAGSPIMAVSKPHGSSNYGTGGGPDATFGIGNSGGKLQVTPNSILEVEEKGGAWLVQMSAEATTALEAYYKLIRTISIENCGGSRISEESLTGAKSGYALELLNQALIWIADNLRLSYGKNGIVELLRMIARINAKIPIACCSDIDLNPDFVLKQLSWGAYYEPSGPDKLSEVQSIAAAKDAGLISNETAVTNAAAMFDVINIEDELAAVLADQAENQKREDAVAEQANDHAIEQIKAKPAPKGPK